MKCNGIGRQAYVPHMYVIEVNKHNGNHLEMFDASIWNLFVVCNEEFKLWCLYSDRIILYVYFSVIFVCFFTSQYSNWGSWLSKYLRSSMWIIGAYNVEFISKYWGCFLPRCIDSRTKSLNNRLKKLVTVGRPYVAN